MEMESVLQNFKQNLDIEKQLIASIDSQSFTNSTYIGREVGGTGKGKRALQVADDVTEDDQRDQIEEAERMKEQLKGAVDTSTGLGEDEGTKQQDVTKKEGMEEQQEEVLLELGGMKDLSKRGVKYTAPPSMADRTALKNYLIMCERTTKRIFDLINELSMHIKHNQQSTNLFNFEVATALLLLTVLILGFRVIAFIFDNQQNYKRLPTSAKTESIEGEQRVRTHRNLYVASNPQLVIFVVLTLFALAFIMLFPFIACFIFGSVIFYMISTAILKVTKEGRKLSKNFNKKRMVISIVSAILGLAYALGFLTTQQSLFFGLLTMLFIVVLLSINEKRTAFFKTKNVIMVAVCGCIIWMHVTYKKKSDNTYSEQSYLLQALLTSDMITYGGLIGVTIISYAMVSVMRRFGATTRPIMVKLFLLKNTVTFVC